MNDIKEVQNDKRISHLHLCAVNVLDLAIGVIIGAAFGAIVTSLVNNIIMPPIGVILGGVDFSQIKIVLQQAGVKTLADGTPSPEVAIGIGLFINAVINFVISLWSCS